MCQVVDWFGMVIMILPVKDALRVSKMLGILDHLYRDKWVWFNKE